MKRAKAKSERLKYKKLRVKFEHLIEKENNNAKSKRLKYKVKVAKAKSEHLTQNNESKGEV